MKVTRSYWLGLGSGLILSAMLALVIPQPQGQAFMSQAPTVPPVTQQATTEPLAENKKQVDPLLTAQGATATQPTVSTTQPSVDQTPNTQSTTPMETSFVIPKGVSSERIADLLVAQGFIKDKASFLVSAKQMGVERQFIAGTFTLSQGLTTEEVIKRLLKK